MLRAYMDDSGIHAGSPNCLLAGYWGGVNQWVKFEREWHKTLDSYKVPEFHAKQFWGRDQNKERVGPYKGWDDNRRNEFLFSLLTIIGKYKLYPFAHGVRTADWKKQNTDERQVFCGGGKQQAPDNPLFMAFRTCVLRTVSYCHPGVFMHFVLDSNENTNAWAAICYGQLKTILSKANDPAGKHLGDLTFADSQRALPLQAADLLAYEAFKYAKWTDGDLSAKPRPSYILALRNFRTKDDFWLFDEVRFANLKRTIFKDAGSLNADE